jgi:hypothetical protein
MALAGNAWVPMYTSTAALAEPLWEDSTLPSHALATRQALAQAKGIKGPIGLT